MIEEIRDALAKMTPGEWGIWVEPCAHPSSAIQELIQQVEHTDPFVGALYLLDAGGKCPAITGCGPTSADNAAGIVTLRNKVPALLEELAAEKARADKAEARLADLKASWLAQAEALATHVKENARLRALLLEAEVELKELGAVTVPKRIRAALEANDAGR